MLPIRNFIVLKGLSLGLVIFGFLGLQGQTVDHNPNRAPIISRHPTGLQISPSNKKVCLCCNRGGIPPLILVNDEEVSSDDFALLNSNTINSVVVLKGAEAHEKFGERGKNGVVLVTANKNWKKKVKKKSVTLLIAA